MKNKKLTFITPYLSGEEMLNLHLLSIRKFYPDDEIIISSVDKSARSLANKYKARLHIDKLPPEESLETNFDKAKNDTIVVCDHDTVILNKFDHLVDKLKEYDLIGIEEKIRFRDKDLWFRYAPGYMDITFLILDRNNAKKKNPSWPKFPRHDSNISLPQNYERHYGICEVLPKHYYLKPFGIKHYGVGNLIKDGGDDILWHQWFGSWQKRGKFISDRDIPQNPYKNIEELKMAQEKFLKDYPNLNFQNAEALF